MREIFYHTRRFITNIKSEKKASDVLSSSRCQLVDIFTVSESYRISRIMYNNFSLSVSDMWLIYSLFRVCTHHDSFNQTF